MDNIKNSHKLDFLNPYKIVGGLRGLISRPFFTQCGFPVVIERNVRFADRKTVALGRWVRLRCGTQVLKNIRFSDNVFVGRCCDIGNDTILERNTSLADYVCILSDTHDFDDPCKRAGKMYSSGTTVIGEGAWLGYRVIVLPQVKSIGRGAVIGAGSVVTKDIPDHVVAVGNPARVIHKLNEETIDKTDDTLQYGKETIETALLIDSLSRETA